MILLDLFSGIGGFHNGLESAGFHFEKVYYSDIDEYANKVYAKRFPDAISLGDIKRVDPNILLRENRGSHWFITGGFP